MGQAVHSVRVDLPLLFAPCHHVRDIEARRQMSEQRAADRAQVRDLPRRQRVEQVRPHALDVDWGRGARRLVEAAVWNIARNRQFLRA